MLGKIKEDLQQNLFKTRLTELINMEHPLVKLADEISWDKMEAEFEKLFSEGGRPSIAIRKIAGILLLKEMFKESDETVVERWIENAYWQYFTGETFFQTDQPFDPSNFVHFRKRIGENGLEFLLGQSVSLHPRAKTEDEVQVDTTVQEKNITFPTDAKLAKKVIDNCAKIAEKEGIAQRQSYKRVSKQLLRSAYFGHHPKRQKNARMARKKLRTIGKRVLRELERKLPEDVLNDYEEVFKIYLKALTQEKTTKDKVYSLHEPQVACIAKGKSGKTYEFGTKVAVVRGRQTGIITSVKRFSGNPHDSRTLEESLSQSERVRKSVGGTRPTKLSAKLPRVTPYDGHTIEPLLEQMENSGQPLPKELVYDRGGKGKSEIKGVKIIIPSTPGKADTAYQKQRKRKKLRTRAAIEPIIGHLKTDFRLAQNYFMGEAGPQINALLSATAWNLKKMMEIIVVR